jgi:hypothetical protein
MAAGALASAVAIAWLVGGGLRAQTSSAPAAAPAGDWTVPRTAFGDPDFQGVWRYEADIALERPAQFAGRELLTDAEVAERQRAEEELAARTRAGFEGVDVGRRPIDESPIRGNEYNSFWQDHGRARKVYRQTSLIVDPRDGAIPFLPEAKQAQQRAAARYGVGPYESYLDPDTGERCLTDGVTAMMWQGPNGGHNRIVQSPGYVTILHEEYRDRRIIPVDGRPHRDIRQWFGDSVGRWEGDTLVVDTTNFIDRSHYEWAAVWTRPTETLHLVERFTRTSSDTLEYRITIEDPKTFTRPWSAVIPISKLPDDTQVYEYACFEGNYAMENLLKGARVAVAARGRQK